MPARFDAKFFSLCLSASAALVACGGGGSDTTVGLNDPSGSVPPPFGAPSPTDTPATPPAPGASTPAPGDSAAASTGSCTALPPLPTRPAVVKNVADFGAVPNDSVDDTDAIQRALDSLQPGDWLVFPPGRYLHSKSLHMRVANTVMWGEGATLHATNPDDLAVWVEASGASVYKFTLTAVTNTRKSTPWESRIAVFGGSNPRRLLSGNVIRGNKVVQSGDPGTPLANSSSSAGIFIYHATNFLVAENLVSRSLADGIHMTAGSSNGRVLNNTVKETGDDMIAVVSYIGAASTAASTVAASFDARKASDLNHHITIANNNVSGQYWGRGITVVGGENVMIDHNTISRPSGAAVYLARETSYLTFGVRNVTVRSNKITDVSTLPPDYTVRAVGHSGHGGIEIYSWLYTDEAAIGSLRDALSVQNIRIDNNTIERTANDGMRIGTGWGKTWSYTATANGASFTRNVTGGKVGLLGLTTNTMASIAKQGIAINNAPTPTYNVFCSANTDDNNPAAPALCSGTLPPVAPACTS
jgi:parallel beta-helix repeat protein